MQDHPPVAEFVAEAFDDERGVGRDGAGGLLLVEDQLPEVVGREVVETHCGTALVEPVPVQARQFTGERADGGAQLGGSADTVAAPEGQPGGLARRGQHQHAVVGDVGDPPAGGAQRDDVAGP